MVRAGTGPLPNSGFTSIASKRSIANGIFENSWVIMPDGKLLLVEMRSVEGKLMFQH